MKVFKVTQSRKSPNRETMDFTTYIGAKNIETVAKAYPDAVKIKFKYEVEILKD